MATRKLSPANIDEARCAWVSGASIRSLAKRYGVARSTLRRQVDSRERSAAATRRRKRELHDPRIRLLRSAKERSTKLKVPFQLTLADLVVPERCPVLGLELQVNSRGFSDSSPTLDRIVPERGYVASNVVVVSFRANRIKNNATVDELRLLANFYAALTQP